MKKNIYLKEIDVLKGIGIILVVIGHSFPDASAASGISNVFARTIYNIIYSFHMPAFIFASGLVSYKFRISFNDKINAIKKKFERLIIPYFIWAIIYIPFRIILAKYSSQKFVVNRLWQVFIGNNPYSGLWFLYSLFFISVLHIIFIDNKNKLIKAFIISAIFALTNDFIEYKEPIKWIFAYSIYFYLGILFRQHYSKFYNVFIKKQVLIKIFVIFVASFVAKIILSKFEIESFILIPAIFGTILLYSISLQLKNNNFFRMIGSYSMDIYILSGPILVALRIFLYNILKINYGIYAILAIILSILLSFIISSKIIRKSKSLAFLLLGMR